MLLLLVLPILVSGFIVCNNNPHYYYKLHRYEGQYLYLKSAHLGFISLSIFTLLALLLKAFFPAHISLDVVSVLKTLFAGVAYSGNDADLTSFSWVVLVSIGSILYAYCWSACSWLRLRFLFGDIERAKILIMGRVLSDSPMDKLFFESFIHSKPLMLTLESGKVYVGTISSLGEPNENEGMDQEISIIPLLSGVRTKDDMRVVFHTNYDLVRGDMTIVIRQEQVSTASWFDFDVYEELSNE